MMPRRIIAMIILGALSAFVSHTLLSTYYTKPTLPKIVHNTTKSQSSSTLAPQKSPRGLPSRLVIPKINVNASVLHLGVTKEGDMDVPAELFNTGWYKYGPRPGEPGSSVIAGHLEGVNEPGVFIDLGKLVKGDAISVIDDRSVSTVFTVQETRTYNQEERPADVFSDITGTRLNLITCTGTWNNTQQRYSKRLVVFAEKST